MDARTFNLLPTDGFFIKLLNNKLLAEQKASRNFHPPTSQVLGFCPTPAGEKPAAGGAAGAALDGAHGGPVPGAGPKGRAGPAARGWGGQLVRWGNTWGLAPCFFFFFFFFFSFFFFYGDVLGTWGV